jgi:molecular chaperone GrpE
MNECNPETLAAGSQETGESKSQDTSVVDELNNKYLRLYAEFDNYRKKVNKDREELAKYGNESLIYELLPIIDSLELALKHAADDSQVGIVQGVQMTLKELHRTLEKFGVSKIEAAGKRFDPSIHHAMTQVERDDIDEKMVAEELRSGYLYREKVLRPSLVAVSVKTQKKSAEAAMNAPAETAEAPQAIKIKINEKIKEDE